jgi:hypothetical protein
VIKAAINRANRFNGFLKADSTLSIEFHQAHYLIALGALTDRKETVETALQLRLPVCITGLKPRRE